MRLFNFGNELSIFFIECILRGFVFEIGDWWGFDRTEEICWKRYLIIYLKKKRKIEYTSKVKNSSFFQISCINKQIKMYIYLYELKRYIIIFLSIESYHKYWNRMCYSSEIFQSERKKEGGKRVFQKCSFMHSKLSYYSVLIHASSVDVIRSKLKLTADRAVFVLGTPGICTQWASCEAHCFRKHARNTNTKTARLFEIYVYSLLPVVYPGNSIFV